VARAHGDARALKTDRAGFVWDPRLASHVYRDDHPLKPRRLIGVHDRLEALGAFHDPNAIVLAPRDATIAEIQAATGWLPHTTRAFVSTKFRGQVTTDKVEGRGRVYRVAA